MNEAADRRAPAPRRFARHEDKYLVPTGVRDALWQALLGPLAPDREGSPDGAYQVTSLYYDTADLACHHAKRAGRDHRQLRIRRYGAAATEVMVEIKQRLGGAVEKRRLGAPLAAAYDLCAGHAAPGWSDELDQAVVDEVRALVAAAPLRPTCVIGAHRRALVGGAGLPGLRITADEALWVSEPDGGLEREAPRQHFVSGEQVVLEVKTDHRLPSWLERLLAGHGCAAVAFSKYGEGLARLRGMA